MKHKIYLTFFSTLSLLFGITLQASILAYEGFDSSNYASGLSGTGADFATDNLVGQGAGMGSGFTSNWGGPSTDGQALGDYWLNSNASSSSAYYRASTGQATYTDGSGKTLETTSGQSTFTGDGTRVSLQQFTSTGTNAPPELYISTLVTLDGSATDLSFGSAFLSSTGGNPRPFNFGFTSSGNLNINAWTSGSSSVSGTSAGTYAAGTYLLVARVAQSTGSGDTLDVWVNPLLENELGSGAADLSVNGGGFYVQGSTWSMDGLTVDSAGSGSASFDELRVGTTFSDVTPVIPEPSTLLLSMISLVAFSAKYIIGLPQCKRNRTTN